MAQTAGGFSSYDSVGNREDLSDVIANISPTDTPFLMACGKPKKAKATYHEWQTDNLAAIDQNNAAVEGDDVTPQASSPTERLGNYTQIFRKSVAITGTQESVDKAGRASELALQKAKRMKEIKRDMEAILSGPQAQVAGNDNTPRKARAFEAFIATNDSRGATGTASTGPTDAPNDGTQRPFTEAHLKAVIQSAWTEGGSPNTLIVGPFNKGVVSGFTGRSQARQNVAADKVQATVSLYASDFGDIKIIPSRFTRARSALLIDPEYVSIAELRPARYEPLAKIGDSERGFVVDECTLVVKNEAAHGVIADLTTS